MRRAWKVVHAEECCVGKPVSPGRRRLAFERIQGKYGLSERQAFRMTDCGNLLHLEGATDNHRGMPTALRHEQVALALLNSPLASPLTRQPNKIMPMQQSLIR